MSNDQPGLGVTFFFLLAQLAFRVHSWAATSAYRLERYYAKLPPNKAPTSKHLRFKGALAKATAGMDAMEIPAYLNRGK